MNIKVDPFLYWRCAFVCMPLNRSGVTKADRQVLRRIIRCYERGEPIGRMLETEAERVLTAFKARRRSAANERLARKHYKIRRDLEDEQRLARFRKACADPRREAYVPDTLERETVEKTPA